MRAVCACGAIRGEPCICTVDAMNEAERQSLALYPVPGDNRAARPTKVGRWWSVAIPGADVDTMLRIEWDELASLDDASGAFVEVGDGSSRRFRARFTKREVRRWLGVVVDWPGVEVI